MKETLLRVQPTEGAGDVGAGLAAERGHALRIAFNGHGRAQAGNSRGAIEAGKARADTEIEPARREGPNQQQDAEGAGEEAEAFRDGGSHGVPRRSRSTERFTVPTRAP